MIGTILDRKYRITELIGSGGMALVYKAINMANRRTVAVKMLKDEYKDDAEFLRRFSREANAILTLSHENIVRAYGTGTYNGLPYLVMEYVEGRTLKDLITKNGALPVRTAIGITCQILDALSAAHVHGIIHRDVKPQNVIVTDKGRVKLADFGIAREAKASTVTFSGSKVLGSVHYISPEQAKGTIATEQSDLYSVGVCLYEMLTGTVPFDADSTVTIALMHLQDKPVPPIDLVPDLPHSLNDIVMKALEKEPDSRYHSAREMRGDLVRSLSDPNGTFVNNPEDKGQKSARRPSVYVLIAMCVFVPILLIGIFVLIYATSCRSELPPEQQSEDLIPVPFTATAAPDVTASPRAEAETFDRTVPNLVGYTLDDALRILYSDYGFTNLSVEFTNIEAPGIRANSVVSISAFGIERDTLFSAPSPLPDISDANASMTSPQESPTTAPAPTATPRTGDTDTIVAASPEAPQEEYVSVATAPPPEYPVVDSTVTPTPEPSHEPEQSKKLYSNNTPIRLLVYRKALGSYKADISFPLTFADEEPVKLVEIGFETATFEEIPYRAILHSRLRQSEKKPDIIETATLYWYEPVTRSMYLYVNGIVQSSPQSVTFAK